MAKVKIYLVAGEPSGDLLGSRLMRAFRKQYGDDIEFMGVGGETMEREGLKSLFNIRDLAVMGIIEVIPSIPRVLKRIRETVQDIQKNNPDIVITIDSYSFSARIHKAMKKKGISIPHVHYVAPQVWAWKKKRAKTVHKIFDHLFTLLPFEAKHFEPYGMATTFVGHPVVESDVIKGDAYSFRTKYNIPELALIMVMLPGSRKNEIAYLLPDFMQAAEMLQAKHPNLFVVVPTVKTVEKVLEKQLKHWYVPHVMVTGEKERYDAFAAADFALAASGTVSLELSMAGVPHIIAYRLSPITEMIVKRLITELKYANLINILADKEIIPEMLQDKCEPDLMAAEMEKLLEGGEQNVAPSLALIGVGEQVTPSEKVVQKVKEIIGK